MGSQIGGPFGGPFGGPLGPRNRPGGVAPLQPVPPPNNPQVVKGRTILTVNARAMLAAMIGWTVCATFASVAFNWTFYYVFALAVAGRDIARAHRALPEAGSEPAVASVSTAPWRRRAFST